MPPKTIAELSSLTAYLDDVPVECDVMTRLITTVLQKAGIDHQVMIGKVVHGNDSFEPHYWIDVGDLRIDYRARMWLKGNNVAHGVFDPSGQSTQYEGIAVNMYPLSDSLFTILCTRFSQQIQHPKGSN